MCVPQLDGTGNEHEKITIESFPTLLFWPANKTGEFVTFNDGRPTLRVHTPSTL